MLDRSECWSHGAMGGHSDGSLLSLRAKGTAVAHPAPLPCWAKAAQGGAPGAACPK